VKNSQYSSKYRKNKIEHEIFSNFSYIVSWRFMCTRWFIYGRDWLAIMV